MSIEKRVIDIKVCDYCGGEEHTHGLIMTCKLCGKDFCKECAIDIRQAHHRLIICKGCSPENIKSLLVE